MVLDMPQLQLHIIPSMISILISYIIMNTYHVLATSNLNYDDTCKLYKDFCVYSNQLYQHHLNVVAILCAKAAPWDLPDDSEEIPLPSPVRGIIADRRLSTICINEEPISFNIPQFDAIMPGSYHALDNVSPHQNDTADPTFDSQFFAGFVPVAETVPTMPMACTTSMPYASNPFVPTTTESCVPAPHTFHSCTSKLYQNPWQNAPIPRHHSDISLPDRSSSIWTSADNSRRTSFMSNSDINSEMTMETTFNQSCKELNRVSISSVNSFVTCYETVQTTAPVDNRTLYWPQRERYGTEGVPLYEYGYSDRSEAQRPSVAWSRPSISDIGCYSPRTQADVARRVSRQEVHGHGALWRQYNEERLVDSGTNTSRSSTEIVTC